MTSNKHCKSCNNTKSLSEFYTSSSSKDGYQYQCKPCCSTTANAYLKENPEVWMLSNLKRRAQDKNLPFDLTKEDLVVPDVCPALGIPIRHNPKHSFDSISVDRIIPEKGYVKGNIVLVSDLANRIKTNATPEQIRMVADFYKQLLDSKRANEQQCI